MQSWQWLSGLAVVVAIGAAPTPAPESPVGSWRLISAKENGKEVAVPAGTTVLKHVTPTDFIFVYYDTSGHITVAGGGHYKLSGTRYEESVEYGLGEGMQPYIGKTQVFTLRLEGGRWYQSGTETTGAVTEEVWQRER